MKATTPPEVMAFACRLKNDDHESTHYAMSAGKAKKEFYREIIDCCPDLKYVDIRVRKIKRAPPDPAFRRVADSRGVPFAERGMRVSSRGELGVIVGANSSANFNVLFDEDSKYKGMILNCHPTWMMTYYGKDGKSIKEFTGE